MSERELLSTFDYEHVAAERLPQMVFDYYAGGAGDEITVRENHAAYERLRLLPRFLRNVAKRSTTRWRSSPLKDPGGCRLQPGSRSLPTRTARPRERRVLPGSPESARAVR